MINWKLKKELLSDSDSTILRGSYNIDFVYEQHVFTT